MVWRCCWATAACRIAQAQRGGALYVAPGRVHAVETAERRTAASRMLRGGWAVPATHVYVELGLAAGDGLQVLLSDGGVPDRSGAAWRWPVRRTRSCARCRDGRAPHRRVTHAEGRLSRASHARLRGARVSCRRWSDGAAERPRRAGPLRRSVAVPCTSHQVVCTLSRRQSAAPPRHACWGAAEPCQPRTSTWS